MAENVNIGSSNIGMVKMTYDETEDGTSFSDGASLSKNIQVSQSEMLHEDLEANMIGQSSKDALPKKANITGRNSHYV